MWIDDAYKADTKSVTVKAQSDAYFRILEKQPEMKDVFRLGNYVVWISPSGTALVIDQNDGKEKLTTRRSTALFAEEVIASDARRVGVNSRSPLGRIFTGGLLRSSPGASPMIDRIPSAVVHSLPPPSAASLRLSSPLPAAPPRCGLARLQRRRAELHVPQLRPRTGTQADEGTRPQARRVLPEAHPARQQAQRS